MVMRVASVLLALSLLQGLPVLASPVAAGTIEVALAGTAETPLVQLGKVAALDEKKDYVEALEALDRYRTGLIRRINDRTQASPLVLRAARLCRQVTRGGEAIPFLKPPLPGTDLCLMVEVGGFNVATHPHGGYIYHVTLEGALRDLKGADLAKFGPVRQFNGTPEFLTKTVFAKYIPIPKGLAHGRYRVCFEVTDLLAGSKRLTGEVALAVGDVIDLPAGPPSPSPAPPPEVDPEPVDE